jgi:hypothetical protein
VHCGFLTSDQAATQWTQVLESDEEDAPLIHRFYSVRLAGPTRLELAASCATVLKVLLDSTGRARTELAKVVYSVVRSTNNGSKNECVLVR